MPDQILQSDSLQLAQSPAGAGDSIGKIETTAGNAFVIRTDGSRLEATQGLDIYQGDTVETAGKASIGIVFSDETTFSLGEQGKMVIDEMVYDPGAQEGQAVMNVVQGVFSFVSGQIAKTGTEAMVINTPTATIGIRGTAGGGNVDEDGNTTAALFAEKGGFVGEMVFRGGDGIPRVMNQPFQAITANNDGTTSEPFVMTPQQIGQQFGGAMKALPRAEQHLPDAFREQVEQARQEFDQQQEEAGEEGAPDEGEDEQAEGEGEGEEGPTEEELAQADAEAQAAAEAAAQQALEDGATPEEAAAAAEAAAQEVIEQKIQEGEDAIADAAEQAAQQALAEGAGADEVFAAAVAAAREANDDVGGSEADFAEGEAAARAAFEAAIAAGASPEEAMAAAMAAANDGGDGPDTDQFTAGTTGDGIFGGPGGGFGSSGSDSPFDISDGGTNQLQNGQLVGGIGGTTGDLLGASGFSFQDPFLGFQINTPDTTPQQLTGTQQGPAHNSRRVEDAILATDSIVAGTNSAEVLVGFSDKKDLMAGRAGNDYIYGDVPNGLNPSNGPQAIGTQDTDPTFSGGGGNDVISAGAGDDHVWGGPGDDIIHADVPDITNDKQEIKDLIAALGGLGTDGYGNDYLFGGDGNDELYGAEGTDTLFGGAGDDYMDGGDGADVIHGDLETFSSSSNVSGTDSVSFNDSSSAITLTKLTNSESGSASTGPDWSANDGSDTDLLYDIEKIILGSGNDTVIFNASSDLTGIQSLDGNNGSNNEIEISVGGTVDFTSLGISLTNFQRLDLQGSNTVTMTGNQFDWNDQGYGFEVVSGSTGDTLTIEVDGSIDLSGVQHSGLDSFTLDMNSGSSGTIAGTDNNDIINGDTGSDTLSGGSGDDTITGGLGADTINLDAGSDIVQYTSASEFGEGDTISNFTQASDAIHFDDAALANFTGTGTWSGQFVVVASGTYDGSQANNGTDAHMIWEQSTGNLIYDQDGSGANSYTTVATISTDANLTTSNIETF